MGGSVSYHVLVLTMASYNNFQAPVWTANTGGRPPCTDKNKCNLAFQTDGNLVEYYGSNAVWASNTGGGLGNVLYFQNVAPYMYIVNSANYIVWYS